MDLMGQIGDLFQKARLWRKGPIVPLNDMFARFQQILKENNTTMKMIADMEDKLGGEYVFDRQYLEDTVKRIEDVILRCAVDLNYICSNKYLEIYNVIESLGKQLKLELAGQIVIPGHQNILLLGEIKQGMAEAVGNKAYNLSRVTHMSNVEMSPGFVVTIAGFRKYLAYNNLFDKIETSLSTCKQEGQSVESVAHTIRLWILGGDIPPELRRDIFKAVEKICPESPETAYYSVRSSAVGEDGEMSYAGLHDSFLNVPFRELLSSFKKVLAGMYNPTSLVYRINRQVPTTDMAMAVLYQKMVSSRVAGVAYTIDPNAPRDQISVLGASWGLGKVVVEGRNAVDTYRVSRHPPYTVLTSRICEKKWMITPFENGQDAPVPAELQNQPCLTPAEASMIVEAALTMERFFKRPMDVEWSLDENGRLWILQARPLGIARSSGARSPELNETLRRHQVLMQSQGVIAYRGIGAGTVWMAGDDKSLDRFPSGAVLVARYAIPLLSRVIPRASAVITDVGSSTSHMATVAREFRVPTIVDTGSATDILKPGQQVTVDAERNVVYEGHVNGLLHHQLLERASFESTYEFQLLRRLLKRIAPLTLIDPEGANFNTRGCKTFHDVLRFIHEKSTQTLAQVAEDPGFLRARGGKRLKADLPLNLILIDIGGGLDDSAAKAGWVLPEQITSLPMQALWQGMASPEVWSTNPISADLKGLMSSLTRTQTAATSGNPLAGMNVAVLGATYLNLSLRVGYHFTVVDASLGPQLEKISVFFRFIGGATDISRRSRRAALLMSILEKIGFKVEGKGDLVIARATSPKLEQIKNHLYLVGRLIGFARQLDILMTDDASVGIYFERFMTGCHINPNGPYI
ncbi:MAG: PEP/pyruvate-binding domain-containing protein [Desulfobacterales bacterium]